MRGQTITVTAEVKFNNELVSNALVSFKKPDNTYQELSEISTGRYSSSYKINNEELVSDWILEVIATKEPLMGTTSIDLVIIPASISIELVSPSKSQVSVGETLKLTVNAKYPDGSPVDIPEINSTINNETIILKRISAGVYEANYIVEENASNVGIKLLVNDASNNTGTSSINFSVSGVSFEHYFRAYPYITYPLISGFLISIIAIYLFFHKSKSLNNLSLNKKRLINQKKETQTDYFVNKTISNEQYNKLIAKLDSDIDVIDKKIKSLMKVKKN